MHLVESDSFNKEKTKIYAGVPGDLVEFACKLSFSARPRRLHCLPLKNAAHRALFQNPESQTPWEYADGNR